ncbi:Rho GTPase [Trapelia coarctata]|nr:Rho GTPase [Trapelia coarctata]
MEGKTETKPSYPLKIVFIGDDDTGKSHLLSAFTLTKEPPPPHPDGWDIPHTRLDDFIIPVGTPPNQHTLSLWDTIGEEGHDRLRPLAYPETDVFVLCFSVASRSSFESIQEKWFPEIWHHCPGVPWVLVGTKIDLRDEVLMDAEKGMQITDSDTPTSEEEGHSMAKRLSNKCYKGRYVECSVLAGEGIDEVLDEAITAAYAPNTFPRRTKVYVNPGWPCSTL